jgi:hypothetical protein
MGAGGASTGGGGGVGPAGIKTDGTYGTTKDAKKASSRNEFRTFVKEGGVTGKIIKSITESAKKSKAKKQANVEVGLGKDRMSNYSVGQGGTRETGGGGNENNTPAPIIIKKTAGGQTIQTTAPTEAELSQSAAADAEEYDLRKTKKRGRSMMLLTGPQGLSKDDKLTLGKPSLLGS